MVKQIYAVPIQACTNRAYAGGARRSRSTLEIKWCGTDAFVAPEVLEWRPVRAPVFWHAPGDALGPGKVAYVAAVSALESTVWQSRLTTARDYFAITKPRIIELLVVTTLPALVLAARGVPSFRVVAATLIYGALAAGSANALNCYLDRDIDALMHRTASRPLSRGSITARGALTFGLVLGVIAVAGLALATNLLAAGLTALAIAFYVLVYTALLKRRTSQNIVWGGAAGCMPVLIGWAAVTGSLAWTPVVLFGVVFLWTPPHFWALAFRFRKDYEAASVPMLPVVATARAVARQIVLYTWAMVAVSLLLYPVAHLSPVFLGVAVALGAVFIREAHALRGRLVRGSDPNPMRLFHWSITYLSLLCVAVSLDVLLRAWL
jgi:protoheme IX farnesyltransferase